MPRALRIDEQQAATLFASESVDDVPGEVEVLRDIPLMARRLHALSTFAGPPVLPGEWPPAMYLARRLFSMLDSETLARGSRIRFGKNVRLVGVPAILVGVACIVAAGGATAVLKKAVPILPDTLREARELWRTIRGDRRELNP